MGCCFVQNQNGRIFKEGPSNSDTLSLAPDKLAPRSPTGVFNPCGRLSTRASRSDNCNDWLSSSIDAAGLATRIFASSVSLKRYVSWATNAIWLRTSSRVNLRRSAPYSEIAPATGSQNRIKRCARVVFPAPDGPTKAMVWPGEISQKTSFSTNLRCPG